MVAQLYTPELAIKVLDEFSKGEFLKDVCKGVGMPSQRSWNKWVRRSDIGADGYTFEWLDIEAPLSEHYQYAKTLAADALSEEIGLLLKNIDEEMLKDGKGGSNKINILRARLDYTKWKTGVLSPAYGKNKDDINLIPIQVIMNIGDNRIEAKVGKQEIEDNTTVIEQPMIMLPIKDAEKETH